MGMAITLTTFFTRIRFALPHVPACPRWLFFETAQQFQGECLAHKQRGRGMFEQRPEGERHLRM
jgi:hypothetical protein